MTNQIFFKFHSKLQLSVDLTLDWQRRIQTVGKVEGMIMPQSQNEDRFLDSPLFQRPLVWGSVLTCFWKVLDSRFLRTGGP